MYVLTGSILTWKKIEYIIVFHACKSMAALTYLLLASVTSAQINDHVLFLERRLNSYYK